MASLLFSLPCFQSVGKSETLKGKVVLNVFQEKLCKCLKDISRNVVGSIPDSVIGTFNRHNPSGRTMALGLTQPLTEMSTRNIFWGVKAAGA